MRRGGVRMANDMNESLWSTLPEEFLDHIVAFLPLSALAQFRVVSKKYNAWIFSEEFLKLCAQLPLRGSQVWITCRKMVGLVSTNFKVCADAKLLGSTHEGMLPYFGPQWKRHMRAALGCLLFVDCTKLPADGSGPVHHEVLCDLSTMTCTRLPEPIVRPQRLFGYSHVMFGQCGEDKGAFKIAIMDFKHDEDHQDGKPYSFQVYNSITQSWTELHPEATFQFEYGVEMINCTFIFDKIFYWFRMSSIEHTGRHGIFVFDTNTEKYECAMMVTIVGKKQVMMMRKKIRTSFILGASYGVLDSVKLIAANGRLHLTGWIGGYVFQVFEVDLLNKQLTRIAQKSLMEGISTSADVQVEGHKDCILLSSSKGGIMLYDCCRKKWRGLRDCPLFGELLSNFHFSMENGKEWDAGAANSYQNKFLQRLCRR